MISVHCARCGKELAQPGALVFSPPDPCERTMSVVFKEHLCRNCYDDFDKWLSDHPERNQP